MFDPLEHTAALALLGAIAAALREEFAVGVMIEDQPGFQSPVDAGQVNRAFRVVARTVLRALDSPEDEVPTIFSAILTVLVRQRLADGGLDERDIDVLLSGEPDRDDWRIYFLLTPWEEIEHMLKNPDPDQ